MSLRIAAALALLAATACAAPDTALHYDQRPVRVIASPELPWQCTASLANAVMWWGERGATFSLEVGTGRAGDGNVVVGVGNLPAGTLGRVHPMHEGGVLEGAYVELVGCDLLTVTHELGHVLGLEHSDETGNLMYPTIDLAGWELDDGQLAWAAD